MPMNKGLPGQWIIPDWPGQPANVVAFVTTREGGVSQAPYDSFNPAAHVGDLPEYVAQNRDKLASLLPQVEPLVFIEQVHGIDVLAAGEAGQADAVVSSSPHQACMVMTADCLPVFFASLDGQQVAVAHAGWRGLAAGVLENTLQTFAGAPVSCWLGPAIGPGAFEVGEEVALAFLEQARDPAELSLAFLANRPGHYLCNLYMLAKIRLKDAGVVSVSGGDFCTYSDPRFFSYRRDGDCGRMVSVIYRAD